MADIAPGTDNIVTSNNALETAKVQHIESPQAQHIDITSHDDSSEEINLSDENGTWREDVGKSVEDSYCGINSLGLIA